MKQRGFAQPVFATNTAKKEPHLGEIRIDVLGKEWRYCRAGATALVAGYVGVGVTLDAAHQNEAITSAVAIGTDVLDLTVTAGTAIVADELEGGELMINAGTGAGYSYTIQSNTAISSSGTSINLTLERGIAVALDTTSKFTLVRSPFYGITVSTTVTLPIAGVTPVAVAANAYYWAQRKGLACVMADSTGGTIMQPVKLSNVTSGAIEVVAAVTDNQTIGYLQYGSTSGEFAPVWLTIN